jgi:hypothetical protein
LAELGQHYDSINKSVIARYPPLRVLYAVQALEDAGLWRDHDFRTTG